MHAEPEEVETPCWSSAITSDSPRRPRHDTIVVRDRRTGELLGTGSRAVREVWLNGVRARLGYLGQLRVVPGRRGRQHLGPVWNQDPGWMRKALENWYEEMQSHGLAPPGPNAVRQFIREGISKERREE